MPEPKRKEDDIERDEEFPGERIEEPSEEWQQPEEKPIRVMRTSKERPGKQGKETDQPFISGKEGGRPVSLVKPEESERFRLKWNEIQTHFVDEPREAVKEADKLVSDVIKRVTELFADERSGLEGQWTRGDDVSTEDLRLAMQRYRSFFDRLLSQ